MKQHQAVIRVMEANGGYATLGFLYQQTLKVAGVEWKTKTPFASIRRIVQDERFFFKIRPGLWALKSWRDRLPPEMILSKKESDVQKDFSHTYYQGLLVQIGDLRGFETSVPAQDKNRIFLGTKTLGSLTSVKEIYPFCYSNIVRCAKTIDVIWFNSRKMPAWVFEVEHSTDMKNSLIKFVELQDFRTKMVIVADEARKSQFQQVIFLSAFAPIRGEVRFQSYQQVSDEHSHLFKLKAVESNIYGSG
jgi:hypothetical protein